MNTTSNNHNIEERKRRNNKKECVVSQRVRKIRLAPVASGAKHVAIIEAAHQSSTSFLNDCVGMLRRQNVDRESKYHKKFMALNVHDELPFRASASAVLYHVEKIMVKEERATLRREQHQRFVSQLEEVERCCLPRLTNPFALHLFQAARRLIVLEETMPVESMFLSVVVESVPPQLYLLDEVTTAAVNLAELFQVSRQDAVAVIRRHARCFIADRKELLEEKLLET
jgi:hypothetical protein